MICELSADKWEAGRTFPALRELLQKRFPTARILPFTEFPQGKEVGGIDDDKTADVVAKKGVPGGDPREWGVRLLHHGRWPCRRQS